METRTIIKNAFLDTSTCMHYYNLLNGSFLETGVELLQHIRTVSVVNTCRALRDRYGFPMQVYYDLLDLFSRPSPLRLSELVDLTSYMTFTDSVETIEVCIKLLSERSNRKPV